MWQVLYQFWSFVYAWMVVIKPDSMPKVSFSTFRDWG